MFDWEDEELANIIWGEAGENEDHIVPYPDEIYGERSKEEAANVKLTDKTTVSNSIIHSQERNNTPYSTYARVSTSLPDLSSSNATKLDHERTDEKAQIDGSSQIFDNQPEDRDENFVDYGWANVGSFDDLDRILSNHDLVYENVNTSNPDALWSQKSELLSIDSPSVNLGDLKSDCQHFGSKSGFIKDEKQTNDSGGSKNESQQSASDIIRRTAALVYPIGDVNIAMPDEIAINKCAQMNKELEGQYRQDGKNSSSKATNQETGSSQYKQFINAFPSRGFNNMMVNQHSAGPALPHQRVSSASSHLSDKTREAPLIMTPQEKIEKLRRRQQMRAFLAIRKQQQEIRQFDDYYSNLEKCSQESQMQFSRAGKVEIDRSLSRLISLDVSSSPLEQSDSDTTPVMMDKTTLEDTILHQLQNVIAGLGMRIRVCIRDSLFRLAQNAVQRKNDGDNRRSGDEPSVVMEERASSTKSSATIPDGETKTNPIDRVVAHLLFNTPPGEFMLSPLSAKLHCETTATPTMEFINESYKDDQFVGQENKLRNPCIDNAPNNKTAADGSGVEIEASSQGNRFFEVSQG